MATLCDLTDGDNLDVITPGIDTQDGCEILGKAQVFIVSGGTTPTLEWVFRDSQGNPVDLCECFPVSSASGSESASAPSASGSGALAPFEVQVRLDKALKFVKTAPVCFTGYVVESRCDEGAVRAQIPADVAKKLSAGVYQLDWAIMDNSTTSACPRLVNRSLVSMERSLFDRNFGTQGPPTVMEIRLHLRDNAPSENVLLEDVEFSAEEILLAITRPVRQWNETPPALNAHHYSTCDFPFYEYWIKGIQGYLFEMAGHWYRRNRMQYQAAGVAVDDLNKEREYLQASRLYLDEYRVWLLRKKVELNAYGASGEVSSPYGFNQGAAF